jgi:putative ABC transport system substrate-binding protein
VKRRDFITLLGGAAAAWPLAARAQQPNRIPRIGLLILEQRLEPFRQGLREVGRVEGQNIILEYRPFDRPDGLPALAAELVDLKVDVIVAAGSQAVRAAQRATRSIPIVMGAVSDPVATGFVASLAQPGGNITGLSLLSPELSGKRLELLKEIVAGVSRIAVLWDPDDPPAVLAMKETETAAQALGVTIHAVEARRPDDFDAAFAAATQVRSQALVVLSAAIMITYSARIAQLALWGRLPAIHFSSDFPKVGGLMSYGPHIDALYRRAAAYVDKILKGAKPADLPVEQPTKFELVINLKTAKALGLEIPDKLLALADEVIE